MGQRITQLASNMRAPKGISCASYGIWTAHAWVFCFSRLCDLPTLDIPFEPQWYALYIGMTIALVVTAIACRSKAFDSERTVRMDIVSVGLLCVSAALVFCSANPGGSSLVPSHVQLPMYIFAITLGGAGIAGSYLRWIAYLGTLEARSVVHCVLWACVIGSVAKMVVTLLPDALILVAMLVLPVASVMLIWRAEEGISLPRETAALGMGANAGPVGTPGATSPVSSPASRVAHHAPAASPTQASTAASPTGRHANAGYQLEPRALLPAVICVLVLTLAHSILYGLFSTDVLALGEALDPAFQIGRMLEVAIAGALFIWVFGHNGSFGFNQLWALVSFIMAAAILIFLLGITDTGPWSPISGPGNSRLAFWSFALEETVGDLIVLYYQMALADIVRHSDLHPYLVIGVGWSVYALSRFCSGALFGMVNGAIATDMLQSSQVLLAILLVLFAMESFCLVNRSPFMLRIFSDLDGVADGPEYYDVIDEKCRAIKDTYGLTDRELVVMQLLCKGRSKAYIAETLSISENTVRGHAKRIYTKLDVHCKRDLQDRIGM